MTGRLLLDRLGEHEAAILAIMREAEVMLTASEARDIAGLARARWALMRALTADQLLKQAEVFAPAIARGRGGDAQRAGRMKHANAAMVDAFRGNVTKWSASDVAACWTAYQPSALAMIARLREHVAHERREIGALLAAVGPAGVTPPRAAAPPRPGRPTPAG